MLVIHSILILDLIIRLGCRNCLWPHPSIPVGIIVRHRWWISAGLAATSPKWRIVGVGRINWGSILGEWMPAWARAIRWWATAPYNGIRWFATGRLPGRDWGGRQLSPIPSLRSTGWLDFRARARALCAGFRTVEDWTGLASPVKSQV